MAIDIYPKDQYPYGQWEYQAYYETNSEHVDEALGAKPENTIKLIFSPGDPAVYFKPAAFSTIIRDGGWFGGASSAPEVPSLRRFLMSLSTNRCWSQ